MVRGPEPAWYDLAVKVNRGHKKNVEWRLSKDRLAGYNIHPSEWAWVGTEFDAVIDNNADGLDPLFAQVKDLVLNLQPSTASLNA